MPWFGVSTHVFHGVRLTPGHLRAIADRGFDAVEIFATRTHFDYGDRGVRRDLRQALDTLGMSAVSLHLPICESCSGGVWGPSLSVAARDASSRTRAVGECRTALDAAAELGCRTAVLHLGLPRGQETPVDNDQAAASRSLEVLAAHAAALDVTLALELIPNDLSGPQALVGWLDGVETEDLGVCLDFGHANLFGHVPDAIDALGGWIVTTHLHDNAGREDDHKLPFEGTVPWTDALAAMTKIGYAGPWIFEVPDHGDALRVLDRLGGVRRRLQGILEQLTAPFGFESEA